MASLSPVSAATTNHIAIYGEEIPRESLERHRGLFALPYERAMMKAKYWREAKGKQELLRKSEAELKRARLQVEVLKSHFARIETFLSTISSEEFVFNKIEIIGMAREVNVCRELTSSILSVRDKSGFKEIIPQIEKELEKSREKLSSSIARVHELEQSDRAIDESLLRLRAKTVPLPEHHLARIAAMALSEQTPPSLGLFAAHGIEPKSSPWGLLKHGEKIVEIVQSNIPKDSKIKIVPLLNTGEKTGARIPEPKCADGIAAIDESLTRSGVKVVSISRGIVSATTMRALAGHDRVLVIAAGNNATQSPEARIVMNDPWLLQRTIIVGALKQGTHEMTRYSNFPRNLQSRSEDRRQRQPYFVWADETDFQATSFATPKVAADIATLSEEWQKRIGQTATPKQLVRWIVKGATIPKAPGGLPSPQWGSGIHELKSAQNVMRREAQSIIKGK